MKNEIKKYSELTKLEKKEKPITKKIHLFDYIREFKDTAMPINFIWYSLLDKYNKTQYFEITIYNKCGKITLSDLKIKVQNKIEPSFYGKADNSGEDRPYYNVISVINLFNIMRVKLEEKLSKEWEF